MDISQMVNNINFSQKYTVKKTTLKIPSPGSEK